MINGGQWIDQSISEHSATGVGKIATPVVCTRQLPEGYSLYSDDRDDRHIF